MRGLGLTPPIRWGPPAPSSFHPLSLTWCQFCMERLILGTEPGCSLFMSLVGGHMGWWGKGNLH